MEQEQNNEQFIRGYNSGYRLEDLDSKISTILAQGMGQDSAYQQGMIAGKKQYERERLALEMRTKFHAQIKERNNAAKRDKGRAE